MKRVLSLLPLLLLLASCLTLPNESTVTVSGRGVVTLAPDRAVFTLSFRETAPTTAEARSRVNGKIARALGVLAEEGVDPREIQTRGLSYRTATGWHEGQQTFLGQEASQSLTVTVGQTDDGERLSRIMDSLTLIDGLQLGSWDLQSAPSEELRSLAREMAYQDARDKALSYAAYGNRRLGRLLTLTESAGPNDPGRMVPAAKQEAMLSDAGAGTQIATGREEITVVITAVFVLE